ncbi:hypothetical protein FWF48_00410 [Candidatus Saccharibacteria bacterium]|nr:hypothetical protein [Candidatus Saccharibacteria bacterium]
MKRTVFAKIVLVLLGLLIVGAIVGLISTIITSSKNNQTPETAIAPSVLTTDLDSTKLDLTVRGPIVARENFRTYTISISSVQRVLTLTKGYQGDVISETTEDNDMAAFKQFAFALDRINAANKRQSTEQPNGLDGVCATGQVYEFKIIKNGRTNTSLWTSSCSGSPGTLAVNTQQLYQLFSRQMPDFDSIIRGDSTPKLTSTGLKV